MVLVSFSQRFVFNMKSLMMKIEKIKNILVEMGGMNFDGF